MKKINYIILLSTIFLFSCKSVKTTADKKSNQEKPVRIANDELEYEIIIFDSGFENFLITAPPKSYYSEKTLEAKNRRYVQLWSQRVNNPRYNRNIYEQKIDYDYNIHYGMDVNYKLYQYFKFVEKKYGEKFW